MSGTYDDVYLFVAAEGANHTAEKRALLPDPTSEEWVESDELDTHGWCGAHNDSWICTRPVDHIGTHVGIDETDPPKVVARWVDDYLIEEQP